MPRSHALGSRSARQGLPAHAGQAERVLEAGCLLSDWTIEVQAAWQQALDLVAHAMLGAYREKEVYHEEETTMSSEAAVATNSPAANGAVDRYFDALAVPAFTIDDRAKVTQWNAAIQALTGKTPEEMSGAKVWTAFFEKRQPNPMDATLISEEAEEDEALTFVNGDGETVSMHLRAVPIFSADGEIEGAAVRLQGAGSGGRADEEARQQMVDY